MTNSTRKSYITHLDSLDILDKLSDEQAGKLFKAIKFYQKTKKTPDLDLMLDLVFTPFLNQFIRDDENYEKTCEARRVAGGKGGKQKVANASKSKQNVANLADSDSKSDSDSDSKNKKDSKNKNFTPPTLQEVKNYCQERNNTVNPEKWISHYQSNGWKVGKNSMKDWKAAVRTWEGNSFESKPTQFANKDQIRLDSNMEASKRFLELSGGDDAF
jgi:hypothetical protein